MQDLGLGGARSINAFVKAKLTAFRQMDVSFASLFELMFREKENVLYERSAGYRMVTTTYGQAYEEILALAGTLKKQFGDLARGAVVGLYMDNSLAWIEAFWALLAAGYRPLLMNRRLPDPVLARALADADAQAVLSDGKQFSVPTAVFDSLTPGAPLSLPADFGEEILVMSSGTSEHLKICAYTARELYYQILESYEIIRRCAAIKKHYNGRLKLLTFLPFYHVFGLIAVYIWFAFFSRTFVHLEDMAPTTIVNTIKRHGVTHIFAVPLFWETVHGQALRTIHAKGEDMERRFYKGLAVSRRIGDLPVIGRLFIRKAFRPVREQLFGESVRFMITGGSGIAPATLAFFNGIGYRLANGYGMTEIGITSVELSGRKRILNAGFVGKPLSCAQYRLSEAGELLVRGKATASRIMENGQVLPAGEWYNTRDLAECVRGRYRILGRRDDVIVAQNGENLNPELLEPCFAGEDVNGAALIKEQTPDGIRPVLLVSVRRTLPSARFAAVDDRLRQTAADLGLTALLGKVVYVADPLLAENEFKVNRSRLGRAYAAGELRVLFPEQFARTPDTAEDPCLLRVRELFAAALCKAPDEIVDDADFFLDEGGTSLDYFAMMAGLQEEFGVPFPAQGDKGLNTVAGIAAFLRAEADHVD